MPQFVAALDQGTTSTRFMIFDHSGNVVAIHQKEHEQIYPQPGWVEHNPLEIWARTQEVIAGALAKGNVDLKDIAAVGVTNQRETTVVWDRATGQPVYNAIVWQDTRTADICNRLSKNGGQNRFRRKTGLPLATYFSGPKIKWILDSGHADETAPEALRGLEEGGDADVYPTLGLINEAGEVAGKIKKLFRDKGGVISAEDRQALKQELGDVLWYLTQICTELGLSLDEVASANIEKLFSRLERGQIHGDGDNR